MLHGSPWVYMYSHCHPMITQQRPKGPRGWLRVPQVLQLLSQPGLKTSKPSPVQFWPLGQPSAILGISRGTPHLDS